jgi:hypothetical protein
MEVHWIAIQCAQFLICTRRTRCIGRWHDLAENLRRRDSGAKDGANILNGNGWAKASSLLWDSLPIVPSRSRGSSQPATCRSVGGGGVGAGVGVEGGVGVGVGVGTGVDVAAYGPISQAPVAALALPSLSIVK